MSEVTLHAQGAINGSGRIQPNVQASTTPEEITFAQSMGWSNPNDRRDFPLDLANGQRVYVSPNQLDTLKEGLRRNPEAYPEISPSVRQTLSGMAPQRAELGARAATENCSQLQKDFEREFRSAAIARSSEQWSVTNGSVGNVITTFTGGALGDGCTAWQSWMSDHVQVDTDWMTKGIQFEQVHIDAGPGGVANHNLALVRFPDGNALILDPWRDPDKPFWSVSEYREKFGPILQDQYTRGEAVFGTAPRQEIRYN